MQGNYLNINTLNQADWKEARKENYTNFNSVAVWRVFVPALIPVLDSLKALLQPNEVEKIIRYKQEKDRNHRTISKAALRILLSRYTHIRPDQIEFQRDENNKPYLKSAGFDALHFNVSHSGDWVVIAIATISVGIDVEKLDASFTYQNMLNAAFNPKEANYIEQSEIPYQSFYQFWTRNEGLLKATGKGLVDDLAAVPSLDGVHPSPAAIIQSTESWQITSFNVDENHVASVAFNRVKTKLQFFNFQL